MKMIYKPGGKESVYGINCEIAVVDEAEAKRRTSLKKGKWYNCPLEFPEVKDAEANKG